VDENGVPLVNGGAAIVNPRLNQPLCMELLQEKPDLLQLLNLNAKFNFDDE